MARALLQGRYLRLYSDQLVEIFLDVASGNDANSGLTRQAPKKTLAACLALLASDYNNAGKIWITGTTIAAPMDGFVTISNGEITLAGLDRSPFYWSRSYLETGWVLIGGGIYRKARAVHVARCFDVTVLVGDFYYEFTENVLNPNNPAAGEFGWQAGQIYIHLPGDVNPDTRVIRTTRAGYILQLDGTADLTIIDGRLEIGGANSILCSGTGSCVMRNCYSRYSGTSAGIATASYDFSFYNCHVDSHAGDCINIGAGPCTVMNSEVSYSLSDEGISSHAGPLTVKNCLIHHNWNGGIWSIDGAEQNLFNVESYNNGQSGGALQMGCGVGYGATTWGLCDGCHCHDNNSSGFYCTSTSGNVTVTNLTSGLVEGNGNADVACP